MIDIEKIDWDKMDGLVPAVVQDVTTRRVLMLGYMNRDALAKTQESNRITFYSRSKQRLWEKGETSGNYLILDELKLDCDGDALLVLARPHGPVCHKGTDTCFDEKNKRAFLAQLEAVIDNRFEHMPKDSYITELAKAGIERMAQKVGEEGVEVALAAVSDDNDKLREESADLLFHMMVLWRAAGIKLSDVEGVLAERHGE